MLLVMKEEECVGYIMADDWLQYPAVDFSNSPERMTIRIASASSGGVLLFIWIDWEDLLSLGLK